MGLSTLPPLKAVRVPSILMQQHHKRKHRTSKHHYLLRMRRDESLRLRRLGSGLLEQDVLDSSILTHLVSLLDTNRGGPYVLGGDLPDNDARSHSSEHTGSFKGGAVPLHAARSMGARHTPRGSWPVTVEDTDKEFMGNLPVAAMRDMSTASSSMSSIPQLPPIGKVPLSPIRDVSRETSQLVMLPRIHHDDHDHAGSMPTVQVMPPTPQQSTLTGALATPRSDGQRLQRVTEGDPTLAEVSGYNLSRESTPRDPAAPAPTVRTGRKSKVKGPKVTHGPGGTGILFQPPDRASSIPPHNAFTATPSHAGAVWEHGRMVEGRGHKKVRSLAAGSLESKSVKGSMIMAPDGEIISVGGSVVPSRPHDVGVIGDVTQPHRHYDANMTDESGMSDDEPDEWRTTGRVKKPRSLSSKLSDSVKRTVKRDSETSRTSGAKSAVSSEKGGKESGSGGSIIIKRYSVTSKEPDSDSLASASLQIDYTSGDIDATMSIHSWSYAPKGEEGEFGLVKAGSVRSLPGLSYDGGLKESLNSTAEQTYEDDNSEEDDERWARITERPEEEEVTNMLESREPTMDVIPQTDNLSPDKQPSPGDQSSSGQSSSKEHQHVTTDNLSVTPRDALPASHDEHRSPREKETKSSSKHTTPGPTSKHTTPGVASKHTTPGSASKHVSPGDTMPSPGVLQTPGGRRDSEPIPTANGPRPTPASVSLPPSEGDLEDNRDTGTSRSKSVALQTESATPEHATPRGFPTGTPRRDSGRDSGGEEEEVAGVDQWPPDGTKETLDVVPEESQKSSAAPSRIPSSAVDKRATPAPSRSQTADESGKAGSKAESRKGESRQGSSRTAKSREPSSRRAVSRTGSGQGDGTASRAEQQQQQFQQHGEASVIREETSVTEASRARSSAQDGPQETKPSPAARTSVEDEREQAVTSAAQVEQTGRASKEKGPSRSDKSSSKTGPSPQTESKASRAPSKAGSRGPSQLGRSSKEPGARSPAAPSVRSDARSSGQLKAKGSVSDDKSRGTSSKLSQRSQMTKSRAKDGSRSVSTRLSAARMTTPPPGEESAEHQWDDINDGFEPSDHGSEMGYDDNRPPSTPSSATEDDARVSGEEPPTQGIALSVEGTQMLTPPETPAQGHRTRMTVQESVTEEPEAETATLASQTARSSVTEQDILDTLTEHAKRIADSVLSNTEAGQDLEKDVREAADMWMDTHSTHNISRSHSVQDVLRSGAIQEIMDAQRSSSAGPTTSEYKDLIRQSLTTAVAKAAGLDPEQFPEDAEISPDLLEALASQKLTPDDIAIYHDEETGRPVIKSRQEIAQALGGVSEGHIYMVPNGKGGSYVGSDAGIKRQMSIPADRASLVDNMEYDVISYGGTEVMSERGRPAGKSKAGSKPGSIAGGTIADLKDHPFESVKGSVDASPEAEQDAFEQRLQQMQKDVAGADKKSPSQRRSSKGEDQTPALPGDGSPKLTLDLDGQSVKSGKTGVSQKTEKSEESKKKKAKTPDEPFVVGQSGQKGELEKLYGPVDSPTKKKDKGKADDKASDKSPRLSDKSPRQLDKSPRLSDKSPRKSDKSPRVSDKSPRVSDKSPHVKDKSPQSQLKSPRKSGKTPRPEPTGADAPDVASKPKQTASKQRLPRAKKEKAANPRRGSRALEAREEIEKDEDVKNTQPEITEKETEQRQTERQTKEESEPKVPEARTVSSKAAEQPSAVDSVEQTTPRVADGMPKQKADLSELFGAQGPGSLPQGAGAGKSESKSPVKGKKPKKDDKKEKGKKKGKKKKDKKEEEAAPEPEPTPAAEAPPSAPIPETKEPTPLPPSSREPPVSKPMTASSSERPLQSSPELKTDDEMEFTIVREESSPEPEPPQRTSLPPTYPVEEEEEEEEEDIGDNGEEDNLKAISNREARAAKRAAAAAKRKEEVERRRKEREEQVKREKEELERQEQLKREMEMERRRREEERRLRKQKEAEEADRELREMEEQERRKKLAEERERKAKEEYQRKLEEMRRKQLEEEAKRMELQLQKQKEEEERRAQEELLMSQMAEQERLEYEKKKKEEEEERKRKEEAERLKREEEARQAMEEARRLAEEMARKQAELEARLKFNRALQMEAGGLDHSHDINRAFVFSYFELLQWLGLDIPEFELAKMSQL